MRIAVVGSGCVGVVAGACFAEAGHEVACADSDASRVAALRAGAMPIHEPGLAELVRRNAGRSLSFTTSVAEAVRGAHLAFIAVGTPEDGHGGADVGDVLLAAEQIGRALTGPCVVVNKSTVPVGTAERIAAVLAKVARHPFDLVTNPEFLGEGSAVDDFTRPDRVVVGATSDRAREVMADLYAPFLRTERPILFMDHASAELAKLASNALLATRISFMNDVAALSERLGADVDEVRRAMGADRRIGQTYLFPGVGYGGSCLPRDVRALAKAARDAGLEPELLRAVDRVNTRQKRLLFEKALTHFGGSVAGKAFAVWGLAFKPGTDDLRDAPALALVTLLAAAGARVTVYDPVAGEAAARLLGDDVRVAPDPYCCAEGADALFLATEWNELRAPDWARLAATMRGRVLFDGRNAWDARKAREAGFTYHGVGRG